MSKRGKRIVTVVQPAEYTYLIPSERDDEWDDLCDEGFPTGVPKWADLIEVTPLFDEDDNRD